MGHMEDCLEVMADTFASDNRKFVDSVVDLFMTSKLAPDRMDEGEITQRNRIGLLTLKVVSNHTEALEKRMQNKKTFFWAARLTKQLLVKKVWLIDSTIKDRAINVLRNQKDQVEKFIFLGNRLGGTLAREYSLYLPEVYDGWLNKITAKLLRKPTSRMVKALGMMIDESTFSYTKKEVWKVLEGKSFRFLKDEARNMVQAWVESTDLAQIGSKVEQNLEVMYDLEKKEPGSVKFLHDRFGINCFGRYPAEILAAQYSQRNDRTSPYGLISFPRGDWNGAFYYNGRHIGDLYNQLQSITRSDGSKYNIRIFENGSLFSLGKSVASSFKDYGKIHFLLIGGHGSRKEIWFGDTETVSRDDISQGKGIQRSKEFFVPNPPIVIVACSAGQKGGIAEQMSKISGGEVHGASTETNVDKILVKSDGDRLSFNVTYYKGKTATYTNGEPRH